MRSDIKSKDLESMIISARGEQDPNVKPSTILNHEVSIGNETGTDDPIMVATASKKIKNLIDKNTNAKKFSEKQKNSINQAEDELEIEDAKTDSTLEKKMLQEGKAGERHILKESDEGLADKVLYKTEEAPIEAKPKKWGQTDVPIGAFNTTKIDGEDAFKQHINTVSEAYGANTLNIVSYKEIANKFSRKYTILSGKQEGTKNKFAVFDEESGKKLTEYFDNIDDAKDARLKINNTNNYDEKFIANLLDKSQKTIADPNYSFKMMVVLNDASRNTFHLANKIRELEKKGDEITNELRSNFLLALSLEGNLMKAVKGRQADIARSLGVFNMNRVSSKDRLIHFETIVENAGGSKEVLKTVDRYLALSTKAQRSKFAQSSTFGKLKDMWWSGYVNNLLYGPMTHFKNIFGNFFFGALQLPEHLLASGFGKLRKIAFPKTEDNIRLKSVVALSSAYFKSIPDSWRLAWRALKENRATDFRTKLEMDKMGDPYDINLLDNPITKKYADSDFAKMQNSLFKYYGKVATFPGRALMAEDEFFKSMNRMGYLRFKASENSINLYETIKGTKNIDDLKLFLNEDEIKSLKLIDGRLSDKDAQKIASKFENDILTNPQDYPDIIEEINQYARENTFTNDLEGLFKGVQKTLDMRVAGIAPLRMFAVFVRTPANITSQVMQRTPLTIKGYQNIFKGGKEADKALARMGLGTTSLYYLAQSSMNGRFTGYGPPNYKDRELLLKSGWRPFSIVFKKDKFPKDERAKFEKLLGKDAIHVAADKVYVSYKGLEPISALVGIAASIGEYYTLNPKSQIDDDDMSIFQAGVESFYNYFGEQTYLTGIKDFIDMLTVEGTENFTLHTYNLMSGMAKKVTEVGLGGTPVIGFGQNAFFRQIERTLAGTEVPFIEKSIKTDPEGYYKGEGDAAVAGFIETLDRAYMKTPWRRLIKTKGELAAEKKVLDPITGRPIQIGNGSWFTFFKNTMDTSSHKIDEVRWTMFALGMPEYKPDPFIRIEEDGVSVAVRLTDEEMYEVIRLATQDNQIADEVNDYVFRNNLTDKIALFNETKNTDDFNLAQEQEFLKDIINDFYKDAKKDLRDSSVFGPSIEERLNQNLERLRKHGKFVK
jgi:hypothetical protein